MIQDVIDAMNQAGKHERSRYHLTLGELIEELEAATVYDWDFPVRFSDGDSPTNPHSYRGYYSDLSFERINDAVTVSEFLERLQEIHGDTLTGYKGGQFEMEDNTPLWQAERGSTGYTIVDVETSEEEEQVTLILGDSNF